MFGRSSEVRGSSRAPRSTSGRNKCCDSRRAGDRSRADIAPSPFARQCHLFRGETASWRFRASGPGNLDAESFGDPPAGQGCRGEQGPGKRDRKPKDLVRRLRGAPCKIFGLEDGQSGAEPRVESRSTPGRNKCCITYVHAATPHLAHSYNPTGSPSPPPLCQRISLSLLSFSLDCLSLFLPLQLSTLCRARASPRESTVQRVHTGKCTGVHSHAL